MGFLAIVEWIRGLYRKRSSYTDSYGGKPRIALSGTNSHKWNRRSFILITRDWATYRLEVDLIIPSLRASLFIRVDWCPFVVQSNGSGKRVIKADGRGQSAGFAE